ncbi:MAG TPA: TonB-dependent receptor [Steroidobacteraceae bacterium]|nr:TonB-dependent receptor [Steroidobacteraceae bacterium]
MGHGRQAILILAAAAALASPHIGLTAEVQRDPDEVVGMETMVVTATRTATLIGDQPLRVEALPAEEIEENLTVQPGNLSSLLTELPGVRVQSVAPGLAGAKLQLRGMPARDTLVLTDGLPLLGTEPDAFGLLQTPPLDLARVEVIKGAASALYGGSALAGVLNLVSSTPDTESAVLANATSRGGSDLVGFFGLGAGSPWSGTVTAGAHYQSREDVDRDGWTDLAGYRRFELRPRLWWNEGEDRSVFITAGIVDEDREGGTLPGRVLPDGSPFAESLDTRRIDGGGVAHWLLADGLKLSARLSMTSTRFDRTFGTQEIPSTQTTAFGETVCTSNSERNSWVLGLAFEHEQLAVAAVPGVSYTYNVPAVFAQDEVAPAPWLRLAASARLDVHNVYGTFFSPRVSALFRQPGSDWTLRASIGSGFAAPTPFVDEVEATSLGTLLPLRNLQAERALSASLDIKWTDGGWDVNASVFASKIRDQLAAEPVGPDQFELINAPGPQRAAGAEALIGYISGPLHLLASWSYLDVTESVTPGVRRDVSLLPRQSAELAGILESEKRGRVGLELGYTGKQALADDPFRSESRAYFELNALAEIRFGGIAVFFNAINLTNVRQTHFDPLVRPSPGPGGNPITDAWAPLAGRTFNLGIRAEL